MQIDRPVKLGRRRGTTIVEVTVAMVIVTAAIVLIGQAVGLVGSQQRNLQRRQTATQEAANLMEGLFAIPREQWNRTTLDAWELSESCRENLPGAELRITLTNVDMLPTAKRVRVAIAWDGFGARTRQSVQLSAWRYQSEESP